LLAVVFAAAAVGKLVGGRDLVAAVRRYELVPAASAPVVAALLVPGELALAVSLAAGLAPAAGGAVAAVTLLVFAAAMAVNLRRGRSFACGCGAADSEIRWSLVAGNVALAVLAVAVVVGPADVLAVYPSAPARSAAAAVPLSAVLVWLMVTTVVRRGALLREGLQRVAFVRPKE
jgi:uncharacterized membrane protein YphA (DoxX/SURF4 family)